MGVVWKLHNFSITKILREINSTSAVGFAILDFIEFLHFLKAPRNSQIGSFRTSRFSKIDFTYLLRI